MDELDRGWLSVHWQERVRSPGEGAAGEFTSSCRLFLYELQQVLTERLGKSKNLQIGDKGIEGSEKQRKHVKKESNKCAERTREMQRSVRSGLIAHHTLENISPQCSLLLKL